MFSSFKNAADSLTKRLHLSDDTKSALIAAATMVPAVAIGASCLAFSPTPKLTGYTLVAAPLVPSVSCWLGASYYEGLSHFGKGSKKRPAAPRN